MNGEDTKDVKGRVLEAFPCPFCKKRVSLVASEVVSSEKGKGIATDLFHEMPACDSYVKLTAQDYMNEVKKQGLLTFTWARTSAEGASS